ncbi:MAG: TIGR01777 family oxidoreductase [Planctomycetota bacterium]
MPVPPSELLAWHGRFGAFERLMPPWETLSVGRRVLGKQPGPSGLDGRGPIGDGAVLEMRLHKGPLRLPWIADHHSFRDETHLEALPSSETAGTGRFKDTQRKGPFARWEHEHKFVPSAVWPTGSELEDDVYYRVPMGMLGAALGGEYVEGVLNKMFSFRHARTEADLRRHWAFRDRPRQRVVVSGGTGLIGSQLIPYLQGAGHEVVRLVRRQEDRSLGERATDGAFERRWDPAEGRLDPGVFEGATAVVNLSGHNVASGRYTDDEKRRILESRLQTTSLIAQTIAGLDGSRPALIQASATGFYGHRPGEQELAEDAKNGPGFLSDVCRQWEAAARPAAEAGARVVIARIGLVISPRGSVLDKMLPVFRAFLGGPIGDGTQVWPWIAMDDVLGAMEHVLHSDIAGPVNFCSPAAVSNNAFAKVLGGVLRRPSALRVPAGLIEKLLGEFGRETALKSTHAVPKRLQESGFSFLAPTLEDALRWELWIPRA